MKKILKQLCLRLFKLYGLRRNVSVGDNLHLGILSTLWAPKKLIIGNNVYIGKMCTIECNGTIGDNTMIANNVGIIGKYDHDYSCVGKPIRQAPWIGDDEYERIEGSTGFTIGEDVWIGYGSIILSGVTIGRGSIVAAGSVVTKNVRPYTIVAGNPAVERGIRFTEKQILEHEKKLYSKSGGELL